MKKIIVLTGFFLVGFLFSANAQSAKTAKITKTQVIQKQKIKQGVRSGELTKRETHALMTQQRNIARTKARAKSDGVVTCRERHLIRTKQANANKNIYKQKHDRQVRY